MDDFKICDDRREYIGYRKLVGKAISKVENEMRGRVENYTEGVKSVETCKVLRNKGSCTIAVYIFS